MSRSNMKALFSTAGYRPLDVPILHKADIFLDLTGEALRARLLTTQGVHGDELALRPEMTIPVALHHLKKGDLSKKGSYSYLGPVFRLRKGMSAEFMQMGIESFGRDDRTHADAEVLSLTLEALKMGGIEKPIVSIGDSSLFMEAVSALGLSGARARRLRNALGDKEKLMGTLNELEAPDHKRENEGIGAYNGVLAALSGANPASAKAMVEDLTSIANIKAVGGRTTSEIAERYLKQAALAAEPRPSKHVLDVLRAIAGIETNAAEMSETLRRLAAGENLGLSESLVRFDRRLEALSKRGHAIDQLTFKGYLGGQLDYYSGFVFEVHAKNKDQSLCLIARGGRFDKLMQHLGAKKAIPAIGAALWLEHLPKGDEA